MCRKKAIIASGIVLVGGIVASCADSSGRPLNRSVTAGAEVHVMMTGISTVNFASVSSSQVLSLSVPKDDVKRSHIAFIAADREYKLAVTSGQYSSSVQIPYDGGNHEFDVFWFDGADNLALRVQNPSDTVQQLPKEAPPATPCGAGLDPANIYFVPRLSRVLQGNTCTPSADVRLNLKTDVGVFNTYVANPLAEQFRPPVAVGGGMHSQQVAQLVDWQVHTSDASLTILSKRKDGTEITFATAQPDANGRIVVVIGSAPPTDLASAVDPPRGGTSTSTADPDFEIYYKSCPGPHPIPYNTYLDCGAGKLPEFAPLWMRRNVKTFASADSINGRALSRGRVIGGLDCGPDGQP